MPKHRMHIHRVLHFEVLQRCHLQMSGLISISLVVWLSGLDTDIEIDTLEDHLRKM